MARLEEIGQALRAADAAGNTEDARRLAELYARTKEQQTSVNRPTSVMSAVAARNDLVPQVEQSRFNPNQSTFGYITNELGKSLTGILGLPEAVINRMAGQATPFAPLAALSQLVQRAPGVPTMSGVSRTAGIEPNMRAPNQATEVLTGAGIDVLQNFMFPGGSAATKVLSGLGSYAGRQAMEGTGAGGEFAGSLLGGVVAPSLMSARLSALNSIRQAAGNNPQELMTNMQNNPQIRDRVRQDVLNELAGDMHGDWRTYAAKYAAAQELEQAIPGLRLNLAQQFGAPSIVQRQRALEASSPVELTAADARRNANQAALRGVLGANPSARANAEAAIGSVADTASAQSRDIAAQIARVSDEAAQIAGRIQPADVPALGQRALDIRASELGSARAKANDLMGLATQAAKTENAVFDTSSLVAKARQIQSEPIWDDANYTSIFGKIKGLGGEQGQFDWNPITGATPRGVTNDVTFDDIREMRQAVNADIAAALRSNSPNARAQLRNLEQLKGEIDNVIKSSPFEATKQAYGAFVDYYKREFAPRFLRGVNLLAEKRTSTGESRLPPERVFTAYFRPNGATEMSRYVRLYGENAEAMTAMRDAITDRYAREVVKNGAIDPAAHARFMDRYKTPLATLDRAGFKFASDLSDTAKSFEAVTTRLASLQDAAQRADKDLVRGILTDQFGTRPPEQIVGELLSDPRKTNLVLSRMDAKQARGLVEYMKDDLVQKFSRDGSIDPAAVTAFLGDRMQVQSYRNALAKVYGLNAADEQIGTLRKISEAAQRLDMTPVPASSATAGRPKLGQDELYKTVGFSARTVFSMIRAAVTGRSSAYDAGVVLGGQALATMRENLKNEVYKEIIRDPSSAKMLLQMMQTAPESGAGAAMAKRFIERVPAVAGYFIGASKYPEMAQYSAANFAREQAEVQE